MRPESHILRPGSTDSLERFLSTRMRPSTPHIGAPPTTTTVSMLLAPTPPDRRGALSQVLHLRNRKVDPAIPTVLKTCQRRRPQMPTSPTRLGKKPTSHLMGIVPRRACRLQ